jgi:hypothetical protein
MPINSFLYPGAKVTLGYEVDNSLRLNDGDTPYLNKTYGSAGSRRTMTFSFWVKRSNLGANQYPMSIYDSSTGFQADMRFASTDALRMYATDTSGTPRLHLVTNRVFRDVSAWYHIVWQVDTTQATDSNRVKLYVNGVQETSFSTETYPPQNTDLRWNGASGSTGGVTQVGAIGGVSPFDGYMAEVVFIDGTAYDQTSFGEFDEDSPTVWKPKDVSGLTFGTNGFYLDFENSSALGNDVSGNDNDFTANNLAATDQSTDTCTNNYATFNPLDNYYLSGTFSEGNLKVSIDNNSTEAFTTSTIGVSSGKWYMENKIITTSSGRLYSGVTYGTAQGTNDWPGGGSDQWFYRSEDGKVYNGGSLAYTGATLADGDIVGIALDLDNHKLYFSKNGTFNNSGDPTSGSTGTGAIALDTGQTYFFAVGESGDTAVVSSANFGSPSFSISSGNSDANGYGNFEYSVPSGYYSINSKNLAEFG